MAKSSQGLSWDKLKYKCDPSMFKFKSTEEIEIEDRIFGQDRAISAIDFGVEIESFGYNIFVLGPVGTGKTTAIRRALIQKAQDIPNPPDWVYINNFSDSSHPIALELPNGAGTTFRDNIKLLVTDLKDQLPLAFENEHYQDERKQITEELEKKRHTELEHLAEFAAERNFELKSMGRGFAMIPVKDDKPLPPEDFEKLPKEEQEKIEHAMKEIQEEAESIMELVQDLEEKINERVSELNRRIADMAVGRSIGRLRKKYSDFPEIIKYLNAMKEDVLENVDDFIPEPVASSEDMPPLPPQLLKQLTPDFTRYEVNLLIGESTHNGAPVIFEKHPTYYNLVGRIEHKATQSGSYETDFTMIKPGSLHRANSGYLILEVNELLKNYTAYDALKRCLKNHQIIIEDLNEQFRLVATTGLKPEPIPLNVKVVLIGSPWSYYMLYAYDEDFQKLFKVKADFGSEMKLDDASINDYTTFIATIVKREKLKHLGADAVSAILEYSTRIVEHREKLATSFSLIADLIRESDYWAKQNDHGLITAHDVERALEEKEYRSNRIESKLQEFIEDGTIMVDSDGKVVGQVNGLAVMSYGDFTFGKPSRITALHFAGKSGIINIEREVKLSGRIHDKGVMILTGFIRSKFWQEQVLAFSASLTFEQVYDEIDGDSASSTELYAILSSLSGVPIKQSIAITGSVNQYGDIQPIGGVNYKIEGFFALCKARGLTGEQGVMIPHQNVRNLALKNEIIEAVKEGKFHVWPVTTIDEGIEILTGKPAGKQKKDGTYPKHSIYGKVAARLEQLAEDEENGNNDINRVGSSARGVKI